MRYVYVFELHFQDLASKELLVMRQIREGLGFQEWLYRFGCADQKSYKNIHKKVMNIVFIYMTTCILFLFLFFRPEQNPSPIKYIQFSASELLYRWHIFHC